MTREFQSKSYRARQNTAVRFTSPSPANQQSASTLQISNSPNSASDVTASGFSRASDAGCHWALESGPVVQPKLKIDSPDSPLEREADKVADQVVRLSDEGLNVSNGSPTSIQRKCAKCEDEEEKVQRKEARGAAVEAVSSIEAAKVVTDGGVPLSESERDFFEPRFGHDFSGVRIHTDSKAADSAKAINARAYTFGNHIVFGSGEYSPQKSTDRLLMAHELTHIIQQQGGSRTIQRREATLAGHSRSAEVFSDPVIKAARHKLEDNAGLWNWLLRWISNSSWGTRDCITTIREIVIPSLYEGSDLTEIQRRVAKNATENAMPQVMTGMQEAGFAHKPKTVAFKEKLRVFEKGTPFEHKLSKPVNAKSSVSDYLESQVKGVPGWHAFGMSLLAGYHSVTIFVKVANSKPRFYWADQVRVSSEMHEDSEMGFREYSKVGLDNYIDHYIQSAWDANRSQKLWKIKEKGATELKKNWQHPLDFPGRLTIWKLRSKKSAVREPSAK